MRLLIVSFFTVNFLWAALPLIEEETPIPFHSTTEDLSKLGPLEIVHAGSPEIQIKGNCEDIGIKDSCLSLVFHDVLAKVKQREGKPNQYIRLPSGMMMTGLQLVKSEKEINNPLMAKLNPYFQLPACVAAASGILDETRALALNEGSLTDYYKQLSTEGVHLKMQEEDDGPELDFKLVAPFGNLVQSSLDPSVVVPDNSSDAKNSFIVSLNNEKLCEIKPVGTFGFLNQAIEGLNDSKEPLNALHSPTQMEAPEREIATIDSPRTLERRPAVLEDITENEEEKRIEAQ